MRLTAAPQDLRRRSIDGIAAKNQMIVSSYTVEEFDAEGQKAVKQEILDAMQDMFGGTDFIVGVNFSSVTSE